MTQVPFDTLKLSKTLIANGFSQQQAEALAEMQQTALSDMVRMHQLATKADLTEVEGKLRLEMATIKSDLIRWVVGCNIALGAFIFAVLAYMRP